MKRMIHAAVLLIGLPFLGGCGKEVRHENIQVNCPVDYVCEQTYGGVFVRMEKLSEQEKRFHLKKRRNTVVPVRLIIENTSAQEYEFSPQDVNLPLADVRTVVASLTPSGKAVYLSAVAMGPASAMVVGVGPLAVGAVSGYGQGVLWGVAVAGAVGLAVGAVTGGVLAGVYARNRNKKNREIKARVEKQYFCPLQIPAGKTTSTMLFLKKGTVFPKNINVVLKSTQSGTKDPLAVLVPAMS